MDPNSLLPNISDGNRSLTLELLPVSSAFGSSTGVSSMPYNQINQMDCYEDMFKEITKKLYGDEGLADVQTEAASGIGATSIIYDPDVCRSSDAMALLTPGNGFPQGTIVLQRRPVDDQNVAENVAVAVASTPTSVVEERWFDSEEALSWTTSKIAKYNPVQKVFRCADCDFVGFISRVAEHWLGNHASLRVFQCPKCSYTSAWARCVRMHLTRQHGETVSDNSVWKENPVLEEVTKFLNSLKAKVDQKHESNESGAKKYTCPYCPYATDRRDLFNRHENIHRDDKPFQCYICDKQFNRADHVKKHFSRMHREEDYDMNKVRKVLKPGLRPIDSSGKNITSIEADNSMTGEEQSQDFNMADTSDGSPDFDTDSFSSVATPVKTDLVPGNNQSPATPKQPKGVVKKKKPNEKMYSCSYCPWQGVDNWCLKRHLNTHIKPFLCVLCDYKAARSERLATHVLKVHNKRICLKCVSFLADNLEALHKHIQEKHQNPTVKTGYSCNVCQEYFELRADLEAHAILDHQKVIVQCDLCDFRTTDEISMEAHLREKHDLQPGMGAVAAAAAAAAAVSTHTTKDGVHEKDTAHPIGVNSNLTAKSEKPERTDLKKLNSVRSKTEIVLSTNPHLVANVDLPPVADMEHSISIAAEGCAKGVGQEVGKDKFICGSCGCSLDSENSLEVHEKMHLDGLQQKNTQELSRSYMCSTCSFTCVTRRGIVSHLRTHTGFSARCFAKNCQYSTPFEQSLKEHVALEHNPKSATGHIVCPHCGYGVSSMNLFAAHWRLHHRSLCSLCVNVYKVRYDLKEADIHSIMTPSEAEESETIENIDMDAESESMELSLPAASQSATEATVLSTKKYSTKELKAYKTFKRAFDSYSKKRNENLDFLPKLLEVQILPVLVNKSVVKGKNYAKKLTRKFYQGRTYSVTQLPSFRYREPKTLKRSEYNNCVLTTRANSIGCRRCFYPKCKRRLFKNIASFSFHLLWSHAGKRTFFCEVCGSQFVHLYQVLIHKLKKHKPENLYLQAPEFSLTPEQMLNGFVDQMIPL